VSKFILDVYATCRKNIGLEFSKLSLNLLAVVFNCFSKAAWELQTDFLKPHRATDGFSKAS
jgi:hypothetical protein